MTLRSLLRCPSSIDSISTTGQGHESITSDSCGVQVAVLQEDMFQMPQQAGQVPPIFAQLTKVENNDDLEIIAEVPAEVPATI